MDGHEEAWIMKKLRRDRRREMREGLREAKARLGPKVSTDEEERRSLGDLSRTYWLNAADPFAGVEHMKDRAGEPSNSNRHERRRHRALKRNEKPK